MTGVVFLIKQLAQPSVFAAGISRVITETRWIQRSINFDRICIQISNYTEIQGRRCCCCERFLALPCNYLRPASVYHLIYSAISVLSSGTPWCRNRERGRNWILYQMKKSLCHWCKSTKRAAWDIIVFSDPLSSHFVQNMQASTFQRRSCAILLDVCWLSACIRI
jgi:hypothetical protein